MRSRLLAAITITFVATVSPLLAQDWHWHVGGGWSLPQGTASDKVDQGWHFMFGANHPLRSNPKLELRFDGQFDKFDSNSFSLAEFRTNKLYARVWSAMADLQYNVTPPGRANFYLLGGIGGHYKQAYLTHPGLGWTTVCDPWWGWCYPAVVEGEVVTETQSTFDVGLNGGAGLSFPLGAYSHTQMFVEAKYQWMHGERGLDAVPITIGFRW